MSYALSYQTRGWQSPGASTFAYGSRGWLVNHRSFPMVVVGTTLPYQWQGGTRYEHPMAGATRQNALGVDHDFTEVSGRLEMSAGTISSTFIPGTQR